MEMHPPHEDGSKRSGRRPGTESDLNSASHEEAQEALQQFTELSVSQLMPAYSAGLLFGTEENSQAAIAKEIRVTLLSDDRSEYEVFEAVRDEYHALISRFEGMEIADEAEYTLEDFQDALEGGIEVQDSLLITAFERALRVSLSHL
jgi:hypothetical protein